VSRIARALSLLLFLGGVCGASHVASQPAPGQHRVAFVNVGPAAPNAPNAAALKAGLAELGYVEGKNLTLDIRWGNQRVEQLPGLVNELLALNPRVIVSGGGAVMARVVKAATTTVPVVFVVGDPVAEKIVPNLARPGGNLTGLAVLAGDLEPKRIELLHRIVPKARRIAIIWNPAEPTAERFFRAAEESAKRLGLTCSAWEARNLGELEKAFGEIARARADALFVVADPVLGFHRARIVEFASANRLPGIYFWREFAEIGGLASYGTNLAAIYRRAAIYIDKILKGANPGELPIEQPTMFELVVNLKAARALDITIPQAVLTGADIVIE
jgi:putative ABC transport system substrate-binding protein